jgi:LacI family transcriptional regulator
LSLNLQGVVIAPVFINETQKITAKLDQAKIPYVFINSDIQDENRICFVGQDSYAGGYVAAKLLHYGLKKKGTVLMIDNAISKGNFRTNL